jgi:hypothetical protein
MNFSEEFYRTMLVLKENACGISEHNRKNHRCENNLCTDCPLYIFFEVLADELNKTMGVEQ